jgi:hypothetical protein
MLLEHREPVSDMIERVAKVAGLPVASTPYHNHPEAHSGSSRKHDVRDEVLEGPGDIVMQCPHSYTRCHQQRAERLQYGKDGLHGWEA